MISTGVRRIAWRHDKSGRLGRGALPWRNRSTSTPVIPVGIAGIQVPGMAKQWGGWTITPWRCPCPTSVFAIFLHRQIPTIPIGMTKHWVCN